MTITARPYQGEVDLPLLTPLLQTMPEMSQHRIDLPYRLSSPKAQTGQDGCLWLDEDGCVVAFAAWQYYWAVLDYYVIPGPYQRTIEQEIFSWAMERFRALDQERGNPLPYWVEFREDDQERRAVIEAHGFHLDQDYHYVQFHHSFSEPLLPATVPAGFTLRPLVGESEIDSYAALHRAAFESTSMTSDWRARTLRTPQYQPDLDLVAVAPDGSFAAFCIGWLDQIHHQGQIEPIGVHPAFHRHGLARALLLELLRRFKAHGATSAIVETDSNRHAALQTYESVGFRPTYKVLLKGLWAIQSA